MSFTAKYLILLFFINLSHPAVAETISRNQFFTAEIRNVSKSSNGKIYVTISFISNLKPGSNLEIYNAVSGNYKSSEECKNSVRMVVKNGATYGANNCLPLKAGNWYASGGLNVTNNYESTFVYEFSTSSITNNSELAKVNITIPINVNAAVNVGPNSGRSWEQGRDHYASYSTVITLSFYDVSIN